tara:strand:- start:720 stop:1013 length:294 start_codon:yes stop_codon:yes gene_type:complete
MKAKKNNTPEMRAIRSKIDSIDEKLLPLMIKRSQLVEKALELKVNRSEIVDKKRINEIKKKISQKTRELGGNAHLLSKIWLSIIENFIKFEKDKFKK